MANDGERPDSLTMSQKLKENSGVVHNKHMSDLQPNDLRRRIRELLAIPDRDRTDEEWDELNELEIRTAPGNRASLDHASDKRFNQPGVQQNQGRRQDRKGERKNNGQRQESRGESKPQEQRADGKPKEARPDGQGRSSRRQHRRPKRQFENGGNPQTDGGQSPGGDTPDGGGGAGAGPVAASSSDDSAS